MAEQEMSKAVLEIIDLKLSPILEKLEKIDSNLSSIQEDVDNLKKVLDRPQTCPEIEQFKQIEKKFLVLAKTLGPMMYIMKKTMGANICDGDVKALALLSNEPMEKWHSKDQFEALREILASKEE